MDRREFFDRIRAADGARKNKRPKLEFSAEEVLSKMVSPGESPESAFVRNFESNDGKVFTSAEQLAEFLKSEGCKKGVVDPDLKSSFGLESLFEIDTKFDRYRAPDSYDFGVSAASFAIGENGALVMKDSGVSDRMIAIAPWIHVAVLKRTDIVASMLEGLEKTVDCPYAIWVCGPSKTTDVEGVLVEGVHGPGIQACLIL